MSDPSESSTSITTTTTTTTTTRPTLTGSPAAAVPGAPSFVTKDLKLPSDCTALLCQTVITCITSFVGEGQKNYFVLGDEHGKLYIREATANFAKQTKVESIDEHNGCINCIVATRSYIYSGSDDGSIVCLDINFRVRPKIVFVDHEEAVSCIAVHPTEETRLVSGSLDRTVCIWNLEDGNHSVARCHGHAMKVTLLQLTDEQIFSGSRDGSIRCWRWDGSALFSITAHVGPVVGLKLIPNRSTNTNTLLSVCGGSKVLVSDAKNGKSIQSWSTGHNAVCMVEWESLAFVGCFDGSILCHPLATASTVTMTQHTRAVREFQVSGIYLCSGSDDCTVCIWHLPALRDHMTTATTPKQGSGGSSTSKIKQATSQAIKPLKVCSHRSFVSGFCVSPHTRITPPQMVTADADKRYYVWRWKTAESVGGTIGQTPVVPQVLEGTSPHTPPYKGGKGGIGSLGPRGPGQAKKQPAPPGKPSGLSRPSPSSVTKKASTSSTASGSTTPRRTTTSSTSKPKPKPKK
eukprot:TRINITY_DN94795_c0_g1_i1.p1 TRINITY_DN94795_c0_g1~~TRINITY_DN94795_c0_g1_i1.p1  ORF type:complete len:518 (+),score=24.07 TRINITY_DN94795_c0_g1_i1:59-1612(+)